LLEELVASSGLSEYKFKTGFRKIYGMSWIDFLHEARMKKAYDLVGYTRLPYYEIADRVGYQSLPTFINKFRENVGLSPKRFRDEMQP
jgi:AraC-like DNA-binding protein